MRPFTYEAYRQMLFEMQAAGYKFLGYGEAADPPFCWLRHDVDVDLGFCIRLAAIEAELGIRATYCVMVRSTAYNLLSPTSEQKVKQLLELDHRIGVHFDCSTYPEDVQSDPNRLRLQVIGEARIVETVSGRDVELVSFHRPNSVALMGNRELTHPYPHAYSPRFMREASYFADSGGTFRFGHPLDSPEFRAGKILTINCHPIWWSTVERSPLYALKDVVLKQKEIVRQYLLDNIVGV